MTMENEIKEGIVESLNIYNRRMEGIAAEWSASTKCKACGDMWIWGVKDNLDFTCPKCTAV